MVAAPCATAVTLPVASTVTMLLLLDFHVTALLVVLSGWTLAISVSLSVLARVNSDLFSVMPVATQGLTVTMQVAVRLLPSTVVATMTVIPSATACRLPVASMVATAGRELDQLNSCSASLGKIVATIFRVSPINTSISSFSMVSEVAIGWVT